MNDSIVAEKKVISPSGLLAVIPRGFLLILTFLAPLKFGSMVGVPEFPGTYWADPVSLLFITWPVNVFPLAAAALLLLTLLFIPAVPGKNPWSGFFAGAWLMLALVSLLGFCNASTLDFPIQMCLHTFGLACYALSLARILHADPGFAGTLLKTVLISGLCSCASGLYQYAYGFEATRQHVYEESIRLGRDLAQGQFKGRLMESRVSADFAVCNSYGGYLAMLFPVLVYAFWRFGETRVEPQKIARWVLAVPAGILLLFLLKETGSRGGLFALIGMLTLLLFSVRLKRVWRILSVFCLLTGIAGFLILVRLGRGFASMYFRFDYFLASLKMMIAEPLCGTGWGDFFHDYLRLKLLVNDEAPHMPHNFILSFGAQTGVAGFLIATLILLIPCLCGFFLFRRLRSADSPNRFLILALTGSVAAWSIHSLLELTFETTGSVVVMIALSLILLNRPEFHSTLFPAPRLPVFSPLGISRLRRAVFLTLLTTAMGTGVFAFRLISAERAYAALYERCDLRFARNDEQRYASPEEIYACFQTALKEAPYSPFPWMAIADFWLAHGEFDRSESALNEAIRRAPLRSALYFRKYRLLSRDPARRLEALDSLRKARELSPKNPEYRRVPAF